VSGRRKGGREEEGREGGREGGRGEEGREIDSERDPHSSTHISSPSIQTTPYAPMSPDSLLFSFAKFIELKFYCSYMARTEGGGEEGGEEGGASPCPHSLHKDYIHYFIFRNKVASFR
jgi:hypothetical protein